MKRVTFFSLLLTCTIYLLAARQFPNPSDSASQPFDFESSLNSWVVAQSNPDAGALSVVAIGSGNSLHGLRIDANHAGWFGIDDANAQLPISIDAASEYIFDLSSTFNEGSFAVAFQIGSEYHWCQTSLFALPSNSHKTLKADLNTLLASEEACMGSVPEGASDVRGIWIYLGQEGVYLLDGVRAQKIDSAIK